MAANMQDMEGFTVRYDTIKDYNVSNREHSEVYYNIRYYKSHNTDECSSTNPTSTTLQELIELLLTEINNRDDIIDNIRSCLPLKSA